MSTTTIAAKTALPPGVVDAVRAAIDVTATAFFSAKPRTTVHQECMGPCIVGIISFLGATPWTLTWLLPHSTAPLLAKRFAGFDIPFDSADMGDMAGELVNVLAGEIVAQLDRRGIKTQMSLPMIARGISIEFVGERGHDVTHLDYTTAEGPFTLRLDAAGHAKARVSGN